MRFVAIFLAVQLILTVFIVGLTTRTNVPESANSEPVSSLQLPALENLLSPDNFSNVNQTSANEIKNEAKNLAATSDSSAQVQLLDTYIQDKANDLETNLDRGDFATTSLAISRLTDLLDQINEVIVNAPEDIRSGLTQQVQSLCSTVDSQLEAQALMVPDDLAQDIEITRSKCL